jgi:hypothetical protein
MFSCPLSAENHNQTPASPQKSAACSACPRSLCFTGSYQHGTPEAFGNENGYILFIFHHLATITVVARVDGKVKYTAFVGFKGMPARDTFAVY